MVPVVVPAVPVPAEAPAADVPAVAAASPVVPVAAPRAAEAASAALVAAEHLGVQPSQAAESLGRFQNVRRRLEKRGVVRGVTVYDDFAHHPTAIRTTVDGLRRQVKSGRIIAVFEPRSNTMKLGTMKSQLPWSLEQTDLAICHSGGLDWSATEALASMGPRARVCANIEDTVREVAAWVHAGDHVLCMSNGGFGGIHDKLLHALEPDN